jgi:hypothetical protein
LDLTATLAGDARFGVIQASCQIRPEDVSSIISNAYADSRTGQTGRGGTFCCPAALQHAK